MSRRPPVELVDTLDMATHYLDWDTVLRALGLGNLLDRHGGIDRGRTA